MGCWKDFFLAEEKVQKAIDAMGKIAWSLERFFFVGSDIYVAWDFIRIDS